VAEQRSPEDELRLCLRATIAAFERASERDEVDLLAIVSDELARAGVELPPALTMLVG